MPPVAQPKQYPVGIVGEASYQPAIRRCSAGQRVQIFHELANPYDKKALAVVTENGDTIGYIGRNCWLQDAVHEEGHGCEATIKAVSSSGDGNLGVVLDVTVGGRGIPTRQFDRPMGPTTAQHTGERPKGFLARLFGL